MTKEELERYAIDNRARLEAQEVKIGDTVKVLIGPFAGQLGVVVGKIACAEDYTFLYYEINMYCDVPNEYKCRQSAISANNVIGGLSTSDFEVMCSFKPQKPKSKCGSIAIPVKADFGENVGFALLDRALELQKKYTELEGEIKRLYDFMNVARNGQLPIALKFDNDLLNIIANAICVDFRPLTEEEKKQMFASVEVLNEALKTRE